MSAQASLFHVLKYRAQLALIPDCDPKAIEPLDRTFFRWVFSPMDATRDFLPHARRFPKKVDLQKKCEGWAVSLFVTAETARSTYASLLSRYPNFHKTHGTHLASGHVSTKDGVARRSGSEGHVSFFEFAHADIGRNFREEGLL
jgi:hypothetical protein